MTNIYNDEELKNSPVVTPDVLDVPPETLLTDDEVLDPVPADVIGPELEPEIEDICGEEECDSNTLIEPLPLPDGGTAESSYTIEHFFGTLQEAVTTVWRYHLQTRTHFIHVELNNLYHSILSIVDSLIEQYQGATSSVIENYYNAVFDIFPDSGEKKSVYEYLVELRCFILVCREKTIPKDLTEIWSMSDEILSAIDIAIYKINTFQDDRAIKTYEEFCYENYKYLNENCDCGDDEEEE
ncbi:MAG: hypothetical protein NC548_21215 [Lachnospiraceae bacterium]|nr:hypothetical protein [Lachnospiraceae bacterium]